jgi:hypothetical protein
MKVLAFFLTLSGIAVEVPMKGKRGKKQKLWWSFAEEKQSSAISPILKDLGS